MGDLGNKEIMAKNIQYYMNRAGIDRNKICDALGFKYTTFTDWVKGNTYPRIDKIEKMAEYFGISKADLIERHGSISEDDKILQMIHDKPGLRIMFDVNKHHTDDDIKQAVEIIKAFYRTKEGGNE